MIEPPYLSERLGTAIRTILGRANVLCLLICVVVFVSACSGKSQPDHGEIESEIRHVIDRVDANASAQSKYIITAIEVEDVEAQSSGKLATVSVKLSISLNGAPMERQGRFIFRRNGKAWEIHDRDLQEVDSSTALQLIVR